MLADILCACFYLVLMYNIISLLTLILILNVSNSDVISQLKCRNNIAEMFLDIIKSNNSYEFLRFILIIYALLFQRAVNVNSPKPCLQLRRV